MAKSADFQRIALLHKVVFNPDELEMLQRVFDRVCKEGGIFADAESEREALAEYIFLEAKTTLDQPSLIRAGHSAIAKVRRNI